MATYHVSVIIEIPDGSDDEENQVGSVRGARARRWRSISSTGSRRRGEKCRDWPMSWPIVIK